MIRFDVGEVIILEGARPGGAFIERAVLQCIFVNNNMGNPAIADFDTIINNEPDFQQISAGWYKKIWDNFQKALDAEGCSYWGRLYKEIYENGFMVDKKALKSRLNVPREIKGKGASAVAQYLEEDLLCD